MAKKSRILPDRYVNSIYDVDYNELYALGFRLILTDLDNTLISYRHDLPDEKLMAWKEEVEKIGFTIVVVSNSPKSRVRRFCAQFNTKYVASAKKPLKGGYKKAMKLGGYKAIESVSLGDQLLTDVAGSNRLKITPILVKAIDKKTERSVTKFNRFLEKKFLRKAKRKNELLFNEKLGAYYEENY